MERRSGSVRSAQRDMLCSQIGKLTPRPVALESTNVTVGLYFQGNYCFFFFWLGRFNGAIYIYIETEILCKSSNRVCSLRKIIEANKGSIK